MHESRIKKGELARQVVENPVFNEALIKIKGDLLLKFERTQYDETEKREHLWRQMNALTEIEKALKEHINSALISEATINNTNRVKGI